MLEAIFSLTTLWWVILLLYIPACIGLIVIVLLQKGKGVGFAGAFGVGGGSDTIFGPRSSKSLPQKITYSAAATFMVLALLMSTLSGRVGRSAAPQEVDEAVVDASLTGLFSGEAAAPEAVEPAAEPVMDGDAVTVEEAAPVVDEAAAPVEVVEVAAPAVDETAAPLEVVEVAAPAVEVEAVEEHTESAPEPANQ